MCAFWASDERLLRSRSRLKRCVLPCMMPPFMLSAARAPAAPSHHWRVTDQGWSRVGARRCNPAAALLASAQLVPHALMPPCHTLSPPRALTPYCPSTHPHPTCAASQTLRRDEGLSAPQTSGPTKSHSAACTHATAHASLGTSRAQHAHGCTGLKSPCSSPPQSRGCSPLLVPRLTQLARFESPPPRSSRKRLP